MTEQHPDPADRFTETPVPAGAAASEVLGPEALDQAILVAVIRRDGSQVAMVSNDANRPVIADWLDGLAHAVRTAVIDCPDCAAGVEHPHEEPGE